MLHELLNAIHQHQHQHQVNAHTPQIHPLQSRNKIVNWSTKRVRTAWFTASKPMLLRMILFIKSCHKLPQTPQQTAVQKTAPWAIVNWKWMQKHCLHNLLFPCQCCLPRPSRIPPSHFEHWGRSQRETAHQSLSVCTGWHSAAKEKHENRTTLKVKQRLCKIKWDMYGHVINGNFFQSYVSSFQFES